MHDKPDTRERQSTTDKASMIHTGHGSAGHPEQHFLPQDLINTQQPFWAQKPYKVAHTCTYVVYLHLESMYSTCTGRGHTEPNQVVDMYVVSLNSPVYQVKTLVLLCLG
jgi:hypothetical protein